MTANDVDALAVVGMKLPYFALFIIDQHPCFTLFSPNRIGGRRQRNRNSAHSPTMVVPPSGFNSGSIGTSASIILRLGQAVLSSSSIFFMSLGVGFYSYTAFCFLVTIMGLVIPWSFTLAILDGYSILAKFPVHQSGILRVIILGDMVLSILTLAAASSTASIVDLLLKADVSFCPPGLCSRYQISAATAFLSWLLLLTSSLSNLWLLPSLDID